MQYSIGGWGSIKATFTGQLIDADRETFDNDNMYVSCLDCGKLILTENVKVTE